MNIAIVGTGYVGLVSGACFAEMGNDVLCIDTNKEKIASLRCGEMPIYEPNLKSLVQKNSQAGRLRFTTDITEAMERSEILFIAVGTPSLESGAVDLREVENVAKMIGQHIRGYMLIVTKSTVPVGTTERIRTIIREEVEKRDLPYIPFDVASNPEFLKEGDAVSDFMKPDRIVVGVDSDVAKSRLTDLYKPMLLNNFRVLFMDIPSAEMTKYASNAMLATRISFMNDIANLCERLGADVNMVRQGVGSDSRIGNKFLYPGCGYGGSCFPKDVRGLIDMGRSHGYKMTVLEAVQAVNNQQKELLFEKLHDYFQGELTERRIAVWGLSFKPGTDDIREAPSLVLIDKLLQAGCSVIAYDPIAMDAVRHRLGDAIEYADDIYETTLGADAIVQVTEWREFRMPNWDKIAENMRTRLVLDGRNTFNVDELVDFDYLSIGRPLHKGSYSYKNDKPLKR